MRLFCCDLSLNHPGVAIMDYIEPEQRIDLKYAATFSPNIKEVHGEKLSQIRQWLTDLATLYAPTVYVRERAFSRFAKETQTLNKVVGISDLVAWEVGVSQYRKDRAPSITFEEHGVFDEIAPTSIKKALTGNGKATKEEVAAALEAYVGKWEYDTDNASDATAVGVAWLIQHAKTICIRESDEDPFL